MQEYINVTYKNIKKTDYPIKLIQYLMTTNRHKLFDTLTIPRKSKVLDLGSGRGEYLLAFGTHGYTVEGFDRCFPDEELKAYPFTLGDIEEPLPYKKESFDIVFSKSVVEHLYYPEKLFAEVYRILKPGGCFICLTPDWHSGREIFHEDFTHRTPFTKKSLGDVYKINGFRNVKTKLFTQLPFTWYHPELSFICSIASKFYNKDTKNILVKFSQEKMVLGIGAK